jgi:hypothetical protein
VPATPLEAPDDSVILERHSEQERAASFLARRRVAAHQQSPTFAPRTLSNRISLVHRMERQARSFVDSSRDNSHSSVSIERSRSRSSFDRKSISIHQWSEYIHGKWKKGELVWVIADEQYDRMRVSIGGSPSQVRPLAFSRFHFLARHALPEIIRRQFKTVVTISQI